MKAKRDFLKNVIGYGWVQPGVPRSTQELQASSAWTYGHPMSAPVQLVLLVTSPVAHRAEFSLLTTPLTMLG